ncbi:uncharacterized protein [Mycetomoellerius zeteki]|uniref:uncharacterized protein n=1 Tax=Mycetomoellerius zeteki TaxID=64791 RepID=UPI00084EBC38|nr:PREDICTED: uncharacterized protein LOC108724062 [Trachymyrmex zeteki]
MFYVLLYDAYCITVPAIWMNLQQDTFRMPKKCKQLTVACIKQMLPCVDWNTLAFHKKFGPYETYQQARSIEKAISEMSASDDNIVIPKGNSENSPKKRLIKKPKLYDDISSSDEPKRDNITMPSNYIPIESEYVLDPSNELNKSLITKPAYECTELNDEDSNLESVFDGWVNVVNKSNLNSLSKEISEASKNMFPMQQKRAALEPPVASSSERSTGRPVILSDVIIHPIANNITCEMNFIVKEVMVLRNGAILSLHFDMYTMPSNFLTKFEKDCVFWLSAYQLGLKWEDGMIPYSMVEKNA